MSGRRRKGRRKMTANQRKYFGKGRRKHRRRKARHVAKRHRRSHRRRRHGRRAHHRRRRHGGGGGWLPPQSELLELGIAAGYGKLELAAKGDGNHILNKLPRPIDPIGYTGNTALLLWIGGKLIGGTIGRYARHAALVGAKIAMYQFGARDFKGFDAAKGVMSISGWEDEISGPEMVLEHDTVGALSAEGESMDGLPFDDRVELPMT